MLPKLYREIENGCVPTIMKFSAGKDVSKIGTFPCGDIVDFSVRVPRKIGANSVVMRINRDGERDNDISLVLNAVNNGEDIYSIELNTALLCQNNSDGLFYYEFLFLRGDNILFTDSVDNVNFRLSDRQGVRFRMMIYDKNFETPQWFSCGIMYHIFVDRFFCGRGSVSLRKDAILNEDWEHGVPQFAEKTGDRLANNMFFGGNLWGIAEKLDYLKSLNVSIIYLSPVFKAYSNHKYDTGDYDVVDEMFGGGEALEFLIKKAMKYGMRIILDGVFNHTGSDSRYFNINENYSEVGAYNSKLSPYYEWYNFKEWPDSYESWWGIDILPKLNHKCEGCRKFFTGENGIAQKYIKAGIGGWRLDVADELSDSFLDEFRQSVKSVSEDAVIIGEVWENAADKIAYGKRRRYFRGGQLDSVMNYPLKNSLISYIKFGDAKILSSLLTELWSSYPRTVCNSLMNIVGTHDTERIITVLGGVDSADRTNKELSVLRMNDSQKAAAIRLLKVISTMQYTVYGIPSVYYGDEVGTEGYHDPFCRMPFPWGHENSELLEHYKLLGKIRASNKAFHGGDFRIIEAIRGLIAYERTEEHAEKPGNGIIIAANSGDRAEKLSFLSSNSEIIIYEDLLSGEKFTNVSRLEPDRALILVKQDNK